MLHNICNLFSLLLIAVANLRQEVHASDTTCRLTQQQTRWAGVNLAGLEFGMQPTGTMTQDPIGLPPLSQLRHFRDENVNAFRIPISWQRMQPKIMGELDSEYLALLSKYVEQAVALNANVIIDLHNYARRDGEVIGEAEELPRDSLIDVWVRLAKEYKGLSEEVVFGIMNEPHDVKQEVWFGTLQAVVTAIRNAGATNRILLPADNWSHLESFSTSYHAGMSKISNPDGSWTGLIFEIHEYFDSNGSGTSSDCPVPRTKELEELMTLLEKDNRQAAITEFGGGNNPACASVLEQFVQIAHNSFPHILGYFIWGAGAFDKNYNLVVTILQGGQWIDQSNFVAIKKFYDTN